MGEMRFVGTGETRGYPYLVCKKSLSSTRSTELSFVCSCSYSYRTGIVLTEVTVILPVVK